MSEKRLANFNSRREFLKKVGLGTIAMAGLSFLPELAEASEKTFPVFDDITKTLKKKKDQLPEFVVFKNVNVISMNSDKVLSNQVVIVKHGIIDQVGNASDVKIPSGANTQVIDSTGKFLIPGLNDMHTHFFNKDDLLLFLANGITTVRNMNGNESFLIYKKEVNSGLILGPKLVVSSPTLADDEMLNRMQSNDIDDSGFDFLFDPEEAREGVVYYKFKGYDYIKVFDPLGVNIYNSIIKQAEKSKIKVIGHVPDDVDPILAKQHSIEHFGNSYLRTAGNLEALAKSDTWVCPTLIVYNVGADKSKESDPSIKFASKRLKKEWIRWTGFYVAENDKHFARLGEFVKLGGKVIAGTDCRIQYVMPGFSIHKELELYVKYGLTPFEAMKTATVNAAECLGLTASMGTIEKSKVGELVLLGANPLEKINNTTKIEGVLTAGQYLDRKELDSILEKVETSRK